MSVPRYINDDKSEMRRIKPGWYAEDDDGNLSLGPFSSREACLESRSTGERVDPGNIVPLV